MKDLRPAADNWAMREFTRRSPQAGGDPSRVGPQVLITLGVSAALVGVFTSVLAAGSGDERIGLVAIASGISFALAIRELITRRFRTMRVIAASVIAFGLAMPFQDPDIVHALSAVLILLAMAGHALRVEDGGDNRFLALVAGVWMTNVIWTQPPFASFDLYDAAQWLIQTGLFFFGVRVVGMVTSALSVSERRYGSVFGAARVGLIEADFTAVGTWIAELPVDGPTGLREYLSGHSDQIEEGMSLLEVGKVNRTALDLFGVDSRQSLVQQLARTSNSQNSSTALTEQLVAILEQRPVFETTYTAERADGVRFSAILGTTFPADDNGELILSQGMISLTDASGVVDSLRLRDDLIASVSHELRMPLTSLTGFSRELSERSADFDDAERAQAMDIIVREADALAYIIDNLLVASRGDTSGLSLRMEPVEMATYLATLGLDFGGVIQAGKRLHFGACEAVVYVDQFRLRQILRNLVDNAVTYGGDEITIDAVTPSDRANVGIVTVSDNGAGLAPGQEGVAFGRYQQMARTPDNPLSLGLGLSVALSLAKAMGGDLTYSRQNGLTTFELQLPLPKTSNLSNVA